MISLQLQAAFTFIVPAGFYHPKTRTHVRLLGPGFKTCPWNLWVPATSAQCLGNFPLNRRPWFKCTVYSQPWLKTSLVRTGQPKKACALTPLLGLSFHTTSYNKLPSWRAYDSVPTAVDAHCWEIQQLWCEDRNRRSTRIRAMHVTKQNCMNLSDALLILCASLSRVSWTIHFFFKVLFIFPSLFLFAIGLISIFSFRSSLPPIFGCIPKAPNSYNALCGWCTMCHIQDCHSLWCTVPGNIRTVHPIWRRFSRLEFPVASNRDFELELFLLHSPLLGESLLVSFPLLINV